MVPKSFVGAGRVTIKGAALDLTSTVISLSSGTVFDGSAGYVGNHALEYLKLQNSGGGGISVFNGTLFFINLNFGAITNDAIQAGVGGYIKAEGNYSISGAQGAHLGAYDGAQIRTQSLTVTITGTPAITTCAVAGRRGSILANGLTPSGSATGARYNVSLNGVIFTGSGGSATSFPGNAAGSATTGGPYI